MAVSIEVYRSRIGQYNCRNIRIKIVKQMTYKKKRKNRSRPSIITVAIFIFIASTLATTVLRIELAISPPTFLPAKLVVMPPTFLPVQLVTVPVSSYLNQLGPARPPNPINHNFLSRYKYGNRNKNKNEALTMA